MDSDSEDFVVIGTSFEREEESRSYRQKKKKLATTKALPAHLQVPTDAEGRRRFHGAFEGGFSAGYFNTVGSKEGWTPSMFRSSKGNRASNQEHLERQKAEAYMDDDEREELNASRLEATDQFDTFGDASRRKAQRQHASAAGPGREHGGGGIIPGPIPEDLVVAVAHPAAQRLLRLMGWRPGKGVGRKREIGSIEATDEGKNTFQSDMLDRALGSNEKPSTSEIDDSNNNIEKTNPTRLELLDDTLVPTTIITKMNRHGVGYDPFEGAEEFRSVAELRRRKRNQDPRGLGAGNKADVGEAFGIGVFEESDTDDDAFHDRSGRDDVGHYYEMTDSETVDSDDGNGGMGGSTAVAARLETARRRPEETQNNSNASRTQKSASRDSVRGFLLSKHTLAPQTWYPAPDVPRSFDGKHVFPDENAVPLPPIRAGDTQRLGKVYGTQKMQNVSVKPGSGAPPPPPPRDPEQRKFIDTTAFFVAKNGVWFEQMAREKQKDEPKFNFLRKGAGCLYYAWRLEKAKEEIEKNTGDAFVWANSQETVEQQFVRRTPLDADDRARALGEIMLASTVKTQQHGDNSRLITDTGLTHTGHQRIDVTQIARGDASKLKLALSGAFTSGMVEGGTSNTSQSLPAGLTDAASLAARNEVLRVKEFSEAQKNEEEKKQRELKQPMLSVRTQTDWSPADLLCKRFGVPDPFELGDGRVRPDDIKTTFRSDNLTLSETNQKEKEAAPKFLAKEKREAPKTTGKESGKSVGVLQPTVTPTVTSLPIDLSSEAEKFLQGLFFKKQIFEDSDDEVAAEKRADAFEKKKAQSPPPPRLTASRLTVHTMPEMPHPPPPVESTLKRARETPEAVAVGGSDQVNTCVNTALPDSGNDRTQSSKRAKKEKKREKKARKKARKKEKKAGKNSKKRRRRDEDADSSSGSDSSGSDDE